MAYIVISQKDGEIGRLPLRGSVVIGRSIECDVCIHDVLLSRKHCRLHYARGAWRLVDLESRNGTHVGSSCITHHPLSNDDEFRIGQTFVRYATGNLQKSRILDPSFAQRPSDPFEALSGTVFAFELDAEDAPPQPVIRGKPTPRPSPRTPRGYEGENVDGMVLKMLSDSHDTIVAQTVVINASAVRPSTLRRRPMPRPIVRGRDFGVVDRYCVDDLPLQASLDLLNDSISGAAALSSGSSAWAPGGSGPGFDPAEMLASMVMPAVQPLPLPQTISQVDLAPLVDWQRRHRPLVRPETKLNISMIALMAVCIATVALAMWKLMAMA